MSPGCTPNVPTIPRPPDIPSSPSSLLQTLRCLSLPPDTSSSGLVCSASRATHSRQRMDTSRSLDDQILLPTGKMKFFMVCVFVKLPRSRHPGVTHTWVQTEEFDAFTMVTHCSVVSIHSHTQRRGNRVHGLEFLLRRLQVTLWNNLRDMKRKFTIQYKNTQFQVVDMIK